MMSYNLERISSNIKLIRSKKHWKFSYVANNTGIDEERLRKIELAKAVPKTKELYELSRLYEVTIDDLVYKDLK